MGYKSLKECISDLNSVNELKKIKEEINPELEMASIHLEEFTNDGKAILFDNIKNCNYRAVSNIFGSSSR
ncbi:MAG: UbiD family decarboxylase, partial [Flavobacteriales bacterium]|nr:UbiD family decarboxylase [Flavobacteriales bacterium]